jgi:hypothetical protein
MQLTPFLGRSLLIELKARKSQWVRGQDQERGSMAAGASIYGLMPPSTPGTLTVVGLWLDWEDGSEDQLPHLIHNIRQL